MILKSQSLSMRNRTCLYNVHCVHRKICPVLCRRGAVRPTDAPVLTVNSFPVIAVWLHEFRLWSMPLHTLAKGKILLLPFVTPPQTKQGHALSDFAKGLEKILETRLLPAHAPRTTHHKRQWHKIPSNDIGISYHLKRQSATHQWHTAAYF